MGRAVFPPCCLTWDQTMVGMIKIMVTYFRRSGAPHCSTQCPWPCSMPPPTHASTRDSCFMASGPITSWKIDGKTMETVTDFILGGSKITADGDCSHEIKRCLLLGRKSMINLDSLLKRRDITLPIEVHLFKAMVFPVVRYGCASWTIKKAEHQRIDAFELWCWRRLLRVPRNARRSN